MSAVVSIVKEESLSWFALRVKTKYESAAAEALRRKGYASFTPTYPAAKLYSDRVKNYQIALFPGYVFCQFDPVELLQVVITPLVHSVVCFGAGPASIADEEIETLQRSVRHGSGLMPWAYTCSGQRVRVQTGALTGIEGFLVDSREPHRLVISTHLLQRSIALELANHRVVALASSPS